MRVYVFLTLIALANAILSPRVGAEIRQPPPEGNLLPFGSFPHVKGENLENRNIESLGNEVEKLGATVKETVKGFAAHRNATCLGQACLFQIFPLVYTKIDSGFFGGYRSKLTNISRVDPYLWSLESSVVRSDTRQWLTFLAGDFPKIAFLPLEPRLKIKGYYSRTTETRFFGSDKTFDPIKTRLDQDYRYSLKALGFTSTLFIPLFNLSNQKVSLFGVIASANHTSSSFRDPTQSKLYSDKPRGFEGGVSSLMGAGLLIDARDREVLTRKGWSMELSTQYSNPEVIGRYKFRRFTLIDRRYVSKGMFTFASRFTMDGLFGKEPFWELSSVGGADPIFDISDSTILRGFLPGRYHEKFKLIENLELRAEFPTTRILGLMTQFTWMPVAFDFARLSSQNAVSVSTGLKTLVNRNLLLQTWFSWSKEEKSIYLDFGQDF
jgi:hypothetical protein